MNIDEEIDDEIAKKAEDIWDTVGKKFEEEEVSSTEFKMILIDEMDIDMDDVNKKTIIILFNIVDKVFDTLNGYDEGKGKGIGGYRDSGSGSGSDSDTDTKNKLMYG